MKYNKQEKLWKSLYGVAGITDALRNSTVNAAFLSSGKPKKSVDDIIEEEQNDDDKDFTSNQCKICGEEIENLYSWYNLKHEYNSSKSTSVCSIKCLDAFREQYDADDYEIIEHYRCSAYFECKEIDNLRRKCERAENKSYREISPSLIMSNFCEPAQAGIILSTHKLTRVLKDFSKQTEQQYLSNKEMMEKGAEESAKQFRITTWMTVLVIILTIVNLIPTFLNWHVSVYSDQLNGIESKLSEMDFSDDLIRIGSKIDDITGLISNESGNDNDRIIELLELIQNELKMLNER